MSAESEDLGSLIELYALDMLEEEKVRLVEERLRKNPKARKELEEVREIMAAIAIDPLDEPSTELSSSTRQKVHSLIAKGKGYGAVSITEFISNFFRKPAFAAAAALLVIGFALVFFFSMRGTEPPDVATGDKPGVSTVGTGGTVDEELGDYVRHSAEVFAKVLDKSPLAIKQLMEERDLTVDVGKAMKLLEKDEIKSNPKYWGLVSDIEAVWRDLMVLVEETGEETADRVKRNIAEKKIIERAQVIDTQD